MDGCARAGVLLELRDGATVTFTLHGGKYAHSARIALGIGLDGFDRRFTYEAAVDQ